MIKLLLVSVFAHAAIVGPTSLQGKVVSFDEKVVHVENKMATFDVPRELIPPKLVRKDADVNIALSQDQVAKVHVTKKR